MQQMLPQKHPSCYRLLQTIGPAGSFSGATEADLDHDQPGKHPEPDNPRVYTHRNLRAGSLFPRTETCFYMQEHLAGLACRIYMLCLK